MGGVDKGTGGLSAYCFLFLIGQFLSLSVLVEAAFTVKSEEASEADCLGLIVF